MWESIKQRREEKNSVMERRQFACLTVSLFKEYYLFHARLFSAVAEISMEN